MAEGTAAAKTAAPAKAAASTHAATECERLAGKCQRCKYHYC